MVGMMMKKERINGLNNDRITIVAKIYSFHIFLILIVHYWKDLLHRDRVLLDDEQSFHSK